MDRLVAIANEELRAGGCRISLWSKGEGKPIYLKGTLPPKPGSGKDKPFQQAIPTGCRPNPIGIREAKRRAKRLDGEIDSGGFDWANWGVKPEERLGTAEGLVSRFEGHWFSRMGASGSTINTWRRDYQAFYSQLPPDQELTEKWVLDWIKTKSTPNSRSRKGWCQAISALVEFGELPVSLDKVRALRGRYGSPGTMARRELLTDDQIVEVWDKIQSPKVRWCWGIMAAFGVRNFELWFLDVGDLLAGGYTVQVLQSKKKVPRIAYALPRDWIDRFDLRIPCPLPEIEAGLDHGLLGSKITQLFSKRKIGKAYGLRHCWRERAVRAGIDPAIAARSLGHDAVLSQQVYLNHMREASCRDAFDRIHR